MRKNNVYTALFTSFLVPFLQSKANDHDKENIWKGPSQSVDNQYMGFLKKELNFEPELFPHFSQNNSTTPKEIFDLFGRKSADINFPSGDYKYPHFMTDLEMYNNKLLKRKGWILYVTATPKSAKTIAEIILEKIENVKGQENENVQFKILSNLPNMRTIWYILPLIEENQKPKAGEFITIFPDNLDHALNLAKVIDGVLIENIEKKNLSKDDFHAIYGAAQLGKSGALFTRFGPFIMDGWESLEGKFNGYQMLSVLSWDKAHPWPDSLNGMKQYFQNVKPFGNLEMSFVSPKTGEKITWENRPTSWKILDKDLP